MLHSTKPGIHGERDSGVSGSGYDDTTTMTRDTGLGGDSGIYAGPQFTGTRDRDAGLVQSGVDSTRREGAGTSGGSGYDDTRDTGLSGTGTGSRYDNTRDTGLGGDSGRSAGSQFTGTGERDAGLVQSGVDPTRRAGVGGMTGSSGYDDNTRDTSLTGSGTGLGYDNTTRDLSGSTTGTGYDERTRGTGTGYGSGMTGFDSDRGSSGITGGGDTSTGSSGLAGQAERYVGGSERHHRGDGHPEDIVHPGPHETMTAKALDPHLND